MGLSTRAVTLKTGPVKEKHISFEDVLQKMDEARCASRSQSRIQAIANAQLETMYSANTFKKYSQSLESYSLPTLSRPGTSFSHGDLQWSQYDMRGQSGRSLNYSRSSDQKRGYSPMPSEALEKEEESLDEQKKNQRLVSSAHRFSPTRQCLRAESAMSVEAEVLASSLSRQCCEVLGPNLCNQCAVIHRQQNDIGKVDSIYNALQVSEKNCTTSVLLEKHLPGMDNYQIQTKMARGEISRDGLQERIIKKNERRLKKWAGSVQSDQIKVKPLSASHKPPEFFFTSIRDLSWKIVTGQMKKSYSDYRLSKRKRKPTFTETVCPVFVSPKHVEKQQPKYNAFYEPPLLPKVCQNVAPSFFAGSSSEYTLPERLPDKLMVGSDDDDDS